MSEKLRGVALVAAAVCALGALWWWVARPALSEPSAQASVTRSSAPAPTEAPSTLPPAASPGPSPADTVSPATAEPAPPDAYKVSAPGQTLPDPPTVAQGASRYQGAVWPTKGSQSWKGAATGFVKALATKGDTDAWLDGLAPYVTDRMLERLARAGARDKVASWGRPGKVTAALVSGDIGVALVDIGTTRGAWAQRVSMWFFDDGTWRVDTLSSLPWG